MTQDLQSEPGTVQVLTGREVPLGGIRSLNVSRTLPHRDRSFIGAWCFVDHYGPTQVVDSERDGMDVPPHPHTGLQTVSWLFSGEVEHRDSAGVHAMVRPGEMNLMTSGHGIAHSEVSTPDTSVLHGVQLWVALPESERDGVRDFQHYVPDPQLVDGATVLLFIGELPGLHASPIHTATPLLGAELRLTAGSTVELPINPAFEHAVLVDTGEVTLDGQRLVRGDLGCVDAGPSQVTLEAGADGARLILLGGEPFEESIVMWWNFIGRNHDEIVAAREQYEAGAERFGQVAGYVGPVDRIPAPPIPHVRLRPRSRHGRAPRD